LSGGLLFRGRDGALRDLASLHSTYRRVEETTRALRLLGSILAAHDATPVRWVLDRPVSNSGRLRDLMLRLAAEESWEWTVEVVWAPDKVLADADAVVVSSDSWVLDHAPAWLNLTAELLPVLSGATVVDLSRRDSESPA
jgi:hypothetical protein